MHCNVRISCVRHKPSAGLLGRSTLAGKALCFTDEISFFFLYFLSTHSAHLSPNFHTESNSAKFGVVFNTTRELPDFEPPAFENAARYPNSETKVQCCDYCPMYSPRLVKLGPCTREKALSDEG